MSLANWVTAQYWRQLLPQLHVDDVPFIARAAVFDIDAARGQALETLLIQEGYFQLDPPRWELPVADMAKAIVELENHRWMPVFSFLYDEYWLMYHKLGKMLARLLGNDFKLMPDFWAWHVDPKKGESGWKPHRDRGANSLLPDGRAKGVTVWIPLTDTTPLNGCMYVVPRDRDLAYNTPERDKWNFNLLDIRALPAAAGSVLCWNSELLHWGARSCPRAVVPRISLSYEFQRGDVTPFNQPLMDNGSIPAFPMRLRLVAKQMLQYRHLYPLTADMEALARGVLEKP